MSNLKKRSDGEVIPSFLKDPEGPVTRSNISMDYINYKKMKKRKRRLKVRRQRILVGVLVLGLTFGGMTSVKALKHRLEEPPTITLPEGYTLLPTTETVERGDTIYSIAAEYYDEDLYSGVYDNIHDYVKAILKQNSLGPNTYIHPGDSISLMAITNLDNEYLTQINLLREQIEQIKEENLWIQHVVKNGDCYSYLASLASGSIQETYEIMDQLREKNKIKSLTTGDVIWIINPQLGELKLQLREAQKQFKESLKNEDNKKSVSMK